MEESSMRKERLALLRLVDDLRDLMQSSEGVIGLHDNGDVAKWEDLTEGGAFETWLMSFDYATSVIKSEYGVSDMTTAIKRAMRRITEEYEEAAADHEVNKDSMSADQCAAMLSCLDILKEEQAKSEWISLKDKLPEESPCVVYTHMRNGSVWECMFEDGNFWVDEIGVCPGMMIVTEQVLDWQHKRIPKPPKLTHEKRTYQAKVGNDE